MVKKIDSSRGPSRTDAANEVARTSASSEVSSVKQVRGATATGATQRVRRPTRPMTAAERADLMSIVRQEADKMFDKLPPEKRGAIERAVEMALNGGVIDEEEGEKKES